MSWDLLYNAGASQIHPHIHLFMKQKHYTKSFEILYNFATKFHEQTKNNYFLELIDIHSKLGLAVHHGSSVALSLLVRIFSS